MVKKSIMVKVLSVMAKKSIMAIVLVALILLLNTAQACAGGTPYQGYTYNEWGEPVPAPNGYIAESFITGAKAGSGDFKGPKDLFVDEENSELYIVDSGNNRIVVLGADFTLKRILAEFAGGNGIETLKNPTGVFVSKSGKVYVADRDNGRILVSDRFGKVIRIYGAPVSDLIPDDFVYYPEKIVVDRHGRMYVQAFGAFQGIMRLDSEGKFINFYGSNRVELTAKVMIDRIWKSILTREQKEAMEGFVPIEYSNMFIDSEDFIYACVKASENSTYELKKLNPLGINILRSSRTIGYVYSNSDYGDHPVVYDGETKIDSTFVDICVDGEGFISALDSTRGKVFQYDEESNLMFVFGSLGDQKGTFKNPTSLVSFNGKILVLDAVKNNITVFRLTWFGEQVRKASALYHNGFYMEAVEPWKEVLKHDSNYLLAYVGLGKAYFQMQDYRQAMYYFKLGYDKKGYSDAFKEYSIEYMRENFDTIFLVLALLFASMQLIRKRSKLTVFTNKIMKGRNIAG